MPVDWRSIARRAGYRVAADDSITVVLEGGGAQVISLQRTGSGDTLRARSIIAGARLLLEAADGDSEWRYAWERNRLSDLLGFTVDRRGRLISEAWIPLEGLTDDEFSIYVKELARISDWHEFRLTAEDAY